MFFRKTSRLESVLLELKSFPIVPSRHEEMPNTEYIHYPVVIIQLYPRVPYLGVYTETAKKFDN